MEFFSIARGACFCFAKLREKFLPGRPDGSWAVGNCTVQGHPIQFLLRHNALQRCIKKAGPEVFSGPGFLLGKFLSANIMGYGFSGQCGEVGSPGPPGYGSGLGSVFPLQAGEFVCKKRPPGTASKIPGGAELSKLSAGLGKTKPMELDVGIEPTTSSLRVMCSTE